MPKSLSVITAIEANRLSSEVPFLCLLDVRVINPDTGGEVVTLRIARSPEPVTYLGQLYSPGIFEISLKQEAGKAAEVSLSVNDYTQTLQAYMELYGGGVGSEITFTVVNADRLDEDKPEAQEVFQIIGASSSDYGQEFTLGADSFLMKNFPRRRQTKDFCQHQYKGASCKYAGPLPSCDLTLQGPNGCAAHSNTINFGGFPGINSNGMRYV